MKNLFLLILLGTTITLSAQTESLHLQMDKTICYPSDTVWFRAYVFDNNHLSDLSTNLFVELYGDSNMLFLRETFPLSGSVSIGQLVMPAKAGLYWLRAYTRNSSFFLASLTVREKNKPLVVRNIIDRKESPVITDTGGLTFATVNTPKGISSTIYPKPGSIYTGKPFQLIMKYYDSTTGVYPFTLNKDKQRNFLIEADSLGGGAARGYASLYFYNSDTLVVRQDLFLPQKQIPVDLIRDTGGYLLTIRDTNSWNYSVAVTRFDKGKGTGGDSVVHPPDILHCLSVPGKVKEMDTSFLSFRGMIRQNTKRAPVIISEELIVLTEKDSIKNTRMVNIDDHGQAILSGLYFFDTLYLHFMLTGEQTKRLNNIKWAIVPPIYPGFTPPDSINFMTDTLTKTSPWQELVMDSVKYKYLKAVTVTADFADRNRAIDNRYATGRFASPVRFSFDMTKAGLKYAGNILDYLNKELPGFGLPAPYPTFHGRPATFYLDEQIVNWTQLSTSRAGEIAYIKIIEDFVDDGRLIRSVSGIPDEGAADVKNTPGRDYTPSAMICIYTRKGRDIKILPGMSNTQAIKGYDKPLWWNHGDRTALLWAPYNNGMTYRFSLPDLAGHPIKIVVEGVNRFGDALHFEKIVE